MLNRLVKILSSLRLTVVLLGLGLILVFWGTMAQVHLGLYRAQSEFFRDFLIYWGPSWSTVRFPIFPGGYLIGTLLLINLFAAHLRYYQPGKKKYGIVMIHFGVVLLLVGQLLTDMLAKESILHLRNGDTKNYSESSSHYELVITDKTDPQTDKVIAIPATRLQDGTFLNHPDLPLTVRVQTYFGNAALSEKQSSGYSPVNTTAGFGTTVWWRGLPHETETDKRDTPAGIVEIKSPQGTLGTFLISAILTHSQEFTYNNHTYQMELRTERFYKPFQIKLLEFKHDKYPGTDIPKNFSSRIRLLRPDTGEDREVLIFMNSPLRYNGETFYQASFDPDNQGTVLQVVRNPSWLTPYFACVLVGAGLLVQFLTHLVGFAAKRKTA